MMQNIQDVKNRKKNVSKQDSSEVSCGLDQSLIFNMIHIVK